MLDQQVLNRGVMKVCYRRLNEGQLGRDYKDNTVSMELLASQPEFEAAHTEAEVISGGRKTFAQIVKDTSFIAARLAREEAATQLRKNKADREGEAKEERDKKRRERRELQQRRGLGLSIPLRRIDQDNDEENIMTKKRPRPLPGDTGPDRKSSRHSSHRNVAMSMLRISDVLGLDKPD